MKTFDPNELAKPNLHKLMLSTIGPRPIAFASTVDKDGNHNLSPFSFFNAFGVNPTTLIFSPSRRGRDNTTKHTYENVKEVPEVVINVVNYDIVEQMSLSSTEYPKGTDEFEKSGLTALPSDTIKPMRVAESPVQYECKVREVIETGDHGGAANLVVCEILKIHIREDLVTENFVIHPDKIDLVGRMGGDFYVRANGDAVFEVEKPLTKLGIGIDKLPERIRNSHILSGNDLGKLGNIEKLPTEDEVEEFKKSEEIVLFIQKYRFADDYCNQLHARAKEFLNNGENEKAIKLLMIK
jgi:flavin reductase (DIM6/NTAB) family NADH-FMN oxidoreductase RutF